MEYKAIWNSWAFVCLYGGDLEQTSGSASNTLPLWLAHMPSILLCANLAASQAPGANFRVFACGLSSSVLTGSCPTQAK